MEHLQDAETVEFARVNAFSYHFLGGNPAAVCYLPCKHKDDDWLQRVAKEFNLSETAFLVRRTSKDAAVPEFDLRWFAPKVEVDLCGHATLAAAHVLFSSLVEQETVAFHTRSGILTARKVSGYPVPGPPQEAPGRPKMWSTCKGVIELDFPLSFAQSCLSTDECANVCKALGVTAAAASFCGKTDLGDYLVELSSRQAVEQVQPDYTAMLDFPGRGGVIVTARSVPEDYTCRFFCSKAGILEDPVTGSAHCTLGSYWSDKLGKNKLEGWQASERGGRITVTVDWEERRARLQGGAVTVMAGVLLNAEHS